MTDEIDREWRRHQSKYALVWYARMQRRKQVVRVTTEDDLRVTLLESIDNTDELSEKNKSAVRKDLLLVLAAHGTDKSVASLDDRMRKLLKLLAGSADPIGPMVWVNPSRSEENACRWLECGARPEDHRKIQNFG